MTNDLGRNTFELPDLDETFWGKAILIYEEPYVNYDNPGHLSVVTEDAKEYYVEVGPLELSAAYAKMDRVCTALKDDDNWEALQLPDLLIRKDYAEVFAAVYEVGESEYFSVLRAIAKVLDTGILPEQIVWKGNVLCWNERKKDYTYILERQEAQRLKAEDLDWKPYYVNNIAENGMDGEYALIFKEDGEKINGCKFTIVHDREYDFINDTSELIGYTLCSKHYNDVKGPLHQPEYGKQCESIFGPEGFVTECTFHEYEINDTGWSGLTYKTIEEAKAAALDLAQSNGYDHYNIIRDIDNRKREARGWIRHYGAMAEFQERYQEIMEVVYNFEYPDEASYGGGFIIRALEEQLGIPEERASLMLEHIPMILTKRQQRKAHDTIAKCKEILGEID